GFSRTRPGHGASDGPAAGESSRRSRRRRRSTASRTFTLGWPPLGPRRVDRPYGRRGASRGSAGPSTPGWGPRSATRASIRIASSGAMPLLQYPHGIPVSVFNRLLPYVRGYWTWLVAGGLLAIVVSGADGLIAWLVKPAMDEIFIRRDLTMLKLLPLLILGVYIVKGIGRYGQSHLMASVGERVIAALPRGLYAHIQAMPLAFFQ